MLERREVRHSTDVDVVNHAEMQNHAEPCRDRTVRVVKRFASERATLKDYSFLDPQPV